MWRLHHSPTARELPAGLRLPISSARCLAIQATINLSLAFNFRLSVYVYFNNISLKQVLLIVSHTTESILKVSAITMAKTADENFKQGEEFIQTFHREDLGYDGCIKAYDDEKIVKIYHSMREIMSYDVSGTIANILAGLIPDITKAKILDLAAGSGMIGKGLYDRGFRNVDAHDGAAAMVDYCRTTGHYKDFFTCFVGNGQTLPMEDVEQLLTSIFQLLLSGKSLESSNPAGTF
ncbi:hypothetical protein RRG08_001320 [Elysia crispata]|uniref:Uncharacterized protein n=1 Tax=Elysia crispata TaxID=231223 RepID=A0AAE0ZRC8_9GAST|nr:hypothetical protein RRG08_001320 [Elysia crispata]